MAPGQFATGVAIVTAFDSEQKPLGITISSFSSVSLDPPLILFSVHRDASRLRALSECRGFVVNVLSRQQTELSNRFARATDNRWAGDMPRDVYERALLRECLRQGKPLLGICRGAQLINVEFGGTLHQDLATCLPEVGRHRDAVLYDRLQHDIVLEPGSSLAALYAPLSTARVTSIHHQAVDRLGDGLVIEARSVDDGVVEAFRATSGPWVVGVQWHPEFHETPALLPSAPLMLEFVRACRTARAESAMLSA